MPRFSDDLIKYGETIAVGVAEKKRALVFRNYSKQPFWILAPAGAVSGKVFDQSTREPLPEMRKYNLGQLFDAVDIVKFQQEIVNAAKSVRAEASDYFGKIFGCLRDFYSSKDPDQKKLAEMAVLVEGYLGAPERAGKRSQSRWYKHYEDLGFTGYFPMPKWILEEERTGSPNIKGETFNEDQRPIQPILAPPEPSQFEYADLWELMDAEMHQEYAGLQRISCFAFRNDDRDPDRIFRANGFLPGITRTDPAAFTKWEEGEPKERVDPTAGGKRVRDLAQEIDLARKGDSQAYFKLMQNHYANLGKFLGDQIFKAYVSTTKSVALAKCFGNYRGAGLHPKWGSAGEYGMDAKKTFCYAVRCVGGIEVQKVKEQGKFRKLLMGEQTQKHALASFFEQEVTKPGAIWKDDIVGFRRTHTNTEGQFLSGPIFLRKARSAGSSENLVRGPWFLEELYPDAFKNLFELLSCKSQGDHKGIEKSYPKSPWKKNSWPID